MAHRVEIEDHWPLLLCPLVPISLLGLAALGASPATVLAAAFFGVFLIAALYLTAYIDVAWLFSAAIALTVFSGNWRELGFPTLVSPDRLLLIAAVVVFLLRDPALGRRPYVRLTGTHVVLLVAAAFALCSAIAAGTIGEVSTLTQLFDRFGLLPFLLFTIGPVAFASEHQRRILLGTFLVVGAYLGLIALFEGVGLNALVVPKYIVTLNTKIQAGRARGPFGDAAINGIALFDCAVMAGIAYTVFRNPRARGLALAIAALCVFDLIFTLERSVWVGAVAATLCACLAAPALRRRLPAVAGFAALGVLAAFLLVPGLHSQTSQRIGDQHTEWDRLNLNRAAENMIAARPLFGFGLNTFKQRSSGYFQQNPDFPLTNTGGELHNVFLANAAELGLVGASIWLAALLLAVGGAIVVRGPPQLYPWRIGLIAVAVMWVIVAFLVPMTLAFPNQFLWLLAGVVWPWRYATLGQEAETEPAYDPPEPGPLPINA